MKIIRVFLVFSSCVFLCTDTSFAQKKSNLDLTSGDEKLFNELYFEAERQKALEDYSKAIEIYLECVQINPNVDAVYYQIGFLYNILERYQDAIYYLEKAIDLNKKNKWYLKLLADTYNVLGLHKEEVKIFNTLINLYPKNPNNYLDLIDVYSLMGEYKKAISLLSSYEDVFGVTEKSSLAKQQLYLKTGDISKAAEAINNLLENFPLNTRYYGLLGEMYLANDLTDKAEIIYLKIIEINNDEPKAHLALSNIYKKKKSGAKSYNHLLEAFKSEKLDINTKIQVLISYLRIPNPTQEIINQKHELATITVNIHPENASVYAILADIYYNEGSLEQAKKSYLKSLELDKNQFLVFNQILLIDIELGEFESMVNISKNAIELFPTQANLYLFNGMGNLYIKNYKDAVNSFENGLNFVVENNLLKAEFYSYLGDTYHALNSHKLSDENYEKCLTLTPKNATVLNNYSYYLCIRDTLLEKALVMSQKSNELKPNNPSFQDTYAWVLYKLKKYNEALFWIKKAIKNSIKKSAVLVEHYGDILFRLNNIDEAVTQWGFAKDLYKNPPENLLKKITTKKINE